MTTKDFSTSFEIHIGSKYLFHSYTSLWKSAIINNINFMRLVLLLLSLFLLFLHVLLAFLLFLAFQAFTMVLLQFWYFFEVFIFWEKSLAIIFKILLKTKLRCLLQRVIQVKLQHSQHSEQDLQLAWVSDWVVNTNWPIFPDCSWTKRWVNAVFWVCFRWLADFYEFD